MKLNLHNNTFDSLYSLISEDSSGKTIGLFPGAFKPPHRGHYLTAAMAAKACDVVYIIMSPKERMLGQASADTGVPEWKKYSGLLPGGKQHAQYQKHLNMELAEVDRQTSASKMRVAISNIAATALNINDMDTWEENLSSFIPDDLERSELEEVISLLRKAPEDKVITVEEADGIWAIYLNVLRRRFPNTTIEFKIAEISPIKTAYDLAEEIYNDASLAGDHYTLKLYTGE